MELDFITLLTDILARSGINSNPLPLQGDALSHMENELQGIELPRLTRWIGSYDDRQPTVTDSKLFLYLQIRI